MGNKGGSTNTVSSNSQPPAVFQNALMGALTNAQAAATTPYQNYPGQLQAGFSPDQLAGFGLAESTPGIAAPYINTAAQDINASTTPIWNNVQQYGSGPSQYFNPYVQNVVNSTQAQFNNQNAQQQNQLRGNAASQGALGGDRLGVAQGVLAGQQQIAQAPVIANLYNTGFGQAQQEFNQQQAAQIGANEANSWLNSQAGFGMANLGNQALQSTLTAANALGSVGATQQAQAQQGLNIPYEQWVAQQAYPFQTSGWLSGTTGQLANAAGGTASTTSPGANPWSQVGGLALGTAGLLGQTGAYGSNGWLTGLLSGSGGAAAGATGAALANTAGAATGADLAAAYGVGGLGFARGGATRGYAPGGPVSVSLMPSSQGQGFGVPTLLVDPTATGGGMLPTGGVADYLSRTAAGAAPPGSNALSAPAPAVSAAAPASSTAGPSASSAAGSGASGGSDGIGIAGAATGFGSAGTTPTAAVDPAAAQNAQIAAAMQGHLVAQFGPTLGKAMTAAIAAGKDPTSAINGTSTSNNAPGMIGGALGGLLGGLTGIPGAGIVTGYLGKKIGQAIGGGPVSVSVDTGGSGSGSDGGGSSDSGANSSGTGGSSGANVETEIESIEGASGEHYARGGRLRGFALGGDLGNDDSQEGALTFGSGAGPGIGAPMRDTGEPLPARGFGSAAGANPWLALADAGFGIAAGRSPNALTNIGSGLQRGLESYMTHDQAAKALAARVDEARARLADTQLYHQQTGQIAQGRLGLEAQRLNQGKYTWQSGVGPDPSDPTKQIPGMYRLPSSGSETPQFMPGVTATTKPEAGMLGATAAGTTSDIHGDDYLKTLPNPTMASQVKALAEGRMQFPSGFALKSPYWQQMLTAVSQFDPSFDAINYNTRASTRRDFASGPSAKNVTSLNTVMGHIEALKNAGEALQNGQIPLVNSAVNMIKNATGNPEVNNFQTAADAVADELERAFRGSAGAVTGIRNWRERLNPSASPAQQQGAWKEMAALLDSRIEALGDQYSRGMGRTTDGLTLLSPHAQAAYQAISGRAPEVPTYSQTGKREIGTTGATAPTPATPAAPSWRYSATGERGFKAFSNDGKTWFNPDGSPIGTTPASP